MPDSGARQARLGRSRDPVRFPSMEGWEAAALKAPRLGESPAPLPREGRSEGSAGLRAEPRVLAAGGPGRSPGVTGRAPPSAGGTCRQTSRSACQPDLRLPAIVGRGGHETSIKSPLRNRRLERQALSSRLTRSGQRKVASPLGQVYAGHARRRYGRSAAGRQAPGDLLARPLLSGGTAILMAVARRSAGLRANAPGEESGRGVAEGQRDLRIRALVTGPRRACLARMSARATSAIGAPVSMLAPRSRGGERRAHPARRREPRSARSSVTRHGLAPEDPSPAQLAQLRGRGLKATERTAPAPARQCLIGTRDRGGQGTMAGRRARRSAAAMRAESVPSSGNRVSTSSPSGNRCRCSWTKARAAIR